MAVRRNHAIREIEALGIAGCSQYREYKKCPGNAVHGGGLHKWSVHSRHGPAAILSVMAVRRARHRIAALHRLFGRRRGAAVECIRCKSDYEHRQKNWSSKTHHPLT